MLTLQPDWDLHLERPPIEVEIVETGWGPWREWAHFHHYLVDAKPMPFSTAFTGFERESGDPVAFVGLTGFWAGKRRVARACRMVVPPEWQGAGIGLRFLNAICQREWEGRGFIGAPVPTLMHTAHPALVAALRRAPEWRQVSAKLFGGASGKPSSAMGMKYGGHWRSVAGFRYDGPRRAK